ncbi:MAG: hypothetical protein ACTHOR_17905 [Devosia sp.]
MPSKSPRTPKNTVKVRRLPKVGETLLIPVTVTGIWEDGQKVTVQLRKGQRATDRPEYLLDDEWAPRRTPGDRPRFGRARRSQSGLFQTQTRQAAPVDERCTLAGKAGC